MRDTLTPKQVARAIQVSESSVKRWCDKGTIPTRYTAGGHRRIHVGELLEFLRSNNYQLVRPEVLGLPATCGKTPRVLDRSSAQLTEALVSGDVEKCRQIALDLYLAEKSVSMICDQVVAKSLQHIGDLWQCGDAEVYQERRACEIANRILYELRGLVPAPAMNAPLAIGGAGEGDPYNVATTMVELVLRDGKWNAASLGDNLPLKTLASAIRQHRPRLFWLSCSHILDESAFLEGYSALYAEFASDVAFVVGGRALHSGLRRRMRYTAYCDNMQHLESCARTLYDRPGTNAN